MKILFTLLSLFTILFSLPGQSHLIKIGGSYRNTDYLSHTGNQKIGPQVGYNYRISEKLTLAVNVGHVSDYWEVRRSNDYSSGGTSSSFSSLEERNTAHYRLAVGVGYLF